MGKAAAAVVAVFTMGGAAMTFLSGIIGAYSEPVALAMMGVGLVASSQLIGKTVAAGQTASQGTPAQSKA